MSKAADPSPLTSGPLASRVALAAVIIATLAGGIYFAARSGTDARAYGNDFSVYYFASREIIAGRDPYQHSLGGWTPYLYPPLLAELLVPVALLPLPVAAYVWFLINAASAVAALVMSATLADGFVDGSSRARKLAEPRGQRGGLFSDFTLRKAAIAALALAVVVRFVLDNFDLGQVNIVVAALAVAHVYLDARNKKLSSAIALALAASIKLTPALLILYPLAKWRLKFAAGCAALIVAMIAASFLPFGSRAPAACAAFINRTVRNEQGFDFAYHGNQSLRGAAERMTASEDGLEARPRVAAALALTASIALVVIAGLAARAVSSGACGLAPFFCCVVLVSPLSWKAHFVMLILPVACLVARAIAAPRTAEAYLALAALAAAFVLFNLTSPKLLGVRAAEWADAHSLVMAGALLVYLAAVWQAGRRFVNLKESRIGDQ